MFYAVEAAHNEFGGLNDGTPGDQTKDEVRIRLLTSPNDFTYILRCPNKNKASLIAKDAIAIYKNDNIGYSQYSKDGNKYSARYGLWNAMKTILPAVTPDNPDPRVDFSKIIIPCNTDCSQLVSCILTNNGYASGMYLSTSTEIATLEKLGFTRLKFSLNELQNGDVLWKNGHTAIAVSDTALNPTQPTPSVPDKNEDKDEMFSAIMKSSADEKVWSSGAGPNTRKAAYITILKKDIGFTPNVICIQKQGEILCNTQWMRDQNEGFIYVANEENNAKAGIPVGKQASYFNPDASKIIIPVRTTNDNYIVRIYK